MDNEVSAQLEPGSAQIVIELNEDSPLRGRLLTSEREEVTFVGWLGLIRALSDVVAAESVSY